MEITLTEEEKSNEIWKPIEKYKHYKVSNMGRIRSIDRVDSLGRYHVGKIKNQRPNVRKGSKKKGYLTVTVSEDGIKTSELVHILVAKAFCPRPTNFDTEVNHKDEDTWNNKASNLEWITHTENVRYGTCILRSKASNKGKVKPNREIPVLQVSLSEEVLQEFKSLTEASRQTGINLADINACCLGKMLTAENYMWFYKSQYSKEVVKECIDKIAKVRKFPIWQCD